MLYLFNQSEDFTMIKLKLTSSHLCAHDAPCERSGWTSLIQQGEKKKGKKDRNHYADRFSSEPWRASVTSEGFSASWATLSSEYLKQCVFSSGEIGFTDRSSRRGETDELLHVMDDARLRLRASSQVRASHSSAFQTPTMHFFLFRFPQLWAGSQTCSAG